MPMTVSVNYRVDLSYDEIHMVLAALQRRLRGRDTVAKATALHARLTNEIDAAPAETRNSTAAIDQPPRAPRGRGRPRGPRNGDSDPQPNAAFAAAEPPAERAVARFGTSASGNNDIG